MIPPAKLRVLIVDDHSNWRDLFKDLLVDEYEATPAGSYSEAVEALLDNQEHPFHVAILDIRLDDTKPANEQGLKLADQLKKMTRYTNTIIVTGYPTVHTMREAFQELTVFDYVEKYPESGGPFDRKRFRDVVDRAARDARTRRSTLKCDRGRICDIIDDNSTEREIRRFQQSLRRIHDHTEFHNFDALRGPAKWDRIDHLLEIWETLDELCRACDIYKTEIRRNNRKLEQEFQAICSH